MMRFKEKKVYEEEVITKLATDVMKGKGFKFDELYKSLENHKRSVCKSYSRKFSEFLTEADIEGIYDDTLMELVFGKKYNPEKNSNFCIFFQLVFRNKVIDNVKFFEAEKRNPWIYEEVQENKKNKHCRRVEPLEIQNDFGEYLARTDIKEEFYEDENDAFLIRNAMQSLLEKFSQEGDKQRRQGLLLKVCLDNPDNTLTENREKLMEVVPELTNWESVRKQVQRARKDFRKFFEENS